MNTRIILLIITLSSLCFGMAGLIAGTVGNAWWKIESRDSTITKGLLKTCVQFNDVGEKICVSRNILKFDGQLANNDVNINKDTSSKDLDSILLALIISSLLAFFAISSSATMLGCINNKSAWVGGSVFTAMASILSAIIGFGGLIYAEVKFEDIWRIKHVNHGWSVICAWIGCILCFLSFFIMCILSCCVLPPEEINHDFPLDYPQSDSVSYTNQAFNNAE